eukprot:5793069-Amphidinium_carterae.1
MFHNCTFARAPGAFMQHQLLAEAMEEEEEMTHRSETSREIRGMAGVMTVGSPMHQITPGTSGAGGTGGGLSDGGGRR